MAEYVRFTPEGPWHTVGPWVTKCGRRVWSTDTRSDTPGDYLCKECDRG